MIMKRNIILSLGAAVIVSSCNFLDVPLESSITTANFFQSTSDFDMALTGAYQVMTSTDWNAQHRYGSYFTGFMYVGRVGTDEAFMMYGNNGEEELAKYTFTPDNLFIKKVWAMQYLGIQRTNVVINRMNQYSGNAIPDSERARILGEARFLRGYYYFQLVRYYGEVPLVTVETTDLNELDLTKRSVADVYGQIISDFEFAEQNLPVKNTVGHASKYAATALKAKAYLQMAGKPLEDPTAAAKALAAADDVIANGGYALVADYFSQFDGKHEHNSEYIFDVEFDNTANKSQYGGQVGTTDGVPCETKVYWNQVMATPDVYNRFDAADLRREAVCCGGRIVLDPLGNETLIYDDEYESVYFVYKFRHALSAEGRGSGWVNWCNPINFPITRYADVLLIRAEADIRANGSASAQSLEYVNQVRRRGYGVDINTPKPGVDLTSLNLDVLLDERSRELCFEGHRWADLVRFGKLLDAFRNSGSDTGWKYFETYQSYMLPNNIQERHVIFPIPQDIIDASNGRIEQNPLWK